MEDRHRNLIRNNFLTLVENVNIHELLPCLIQKNVFTRDQVESLLIEKSKSERNCKRELFLFIQRRGPDAFETLVKSLYELDNEHKKLAYELAGDEFKLDENLNNNNKDNQENYLVAQDKDDRLSPIENKTGHAWPYQLPKDQRPPHIRQLSKEIPNSNINLSTEPLIVKVKKSTKYFDNRNISKVPVYPMRSKHRGLFLCINNIEFLNNVHDRRLGAEVDEENLKILFNDIGFSAEIHRNSSYLDMRTTIENFTNEQKNPLLRKVDCVVVAIMSHGEEGHTKESSHIISSDCKHLEVSWILDQFSNLFCPALINKPKIFLFQICRGDNPHPGVPVDIPRKRIQSDGISKKVVVRNMEDILIGFSTLPGDKSYRDTSLGTWYIQAICKIFMEHAHDTHIEDLLKMVDVELKNLRSDDGNMQTTSYENRAFKLCYLHPGLHQD